MAIHIILFLFILWIIAVIIFYIIFKSHRLYCFVYMHKDWKLWDKICKNLKKAEIINYYQKNKTSIYFKFRLTINFIRYDIIYWCDDKTVTVHHGTRCILSNFDKYHSNKAAKIIRQYLL